MSIEPAMQSAALSRSAARAGRYLVVGAVCAGVWNSVIVLGDWLGAHYALAAAAAFVILAPLGYSLHVAFTFKERASWRGFLVFTSGLAAGFPISLAVVAILCSGLGLRPAIAAPISTAVMFFYNYALTHWAVLGRLR